jgi:hypothetical protein
VFTLSAGDLKLLLHYDVQANKVDFVEQLNAPPVAAAAPVTDVARPEPALARPQPAPAQPVYSVVEPRAPQRQAAAKPKPQPKPSLQAKAPVEPPLKANGPCVIKPVMSDQDLVNCGATPPRY